jgi:1,4-alpha-glucan branching enzyme
MGQEFAQRGEWSEARQLDWDHLDDPRHHGMQDMVRDLNRLYAKLPALHARDCEPEGFEWLIADDSANSVFAGRAMPRTRNPWWSCRISRPMYARGYQGPIA